MVTLDSLGTTIQKTRKAQGLTQEALAGACGVGKRFISELENGKPTCQVGKVFSVLATLGISVTLTPPHTGKQP
jgi:HTH-type transcriptional regulator/antitoxin HipB